MIDSASVEIASESGGCFAVILKKRRVGIKFRSEALPNDSLERVGIQIWMKVGARTTLHTMVRPEDLSSVMELYGVEGFFAWMLRGEGNVVRRMPILGTEDMVEMMHKAIDDGDYLLPPRDGESSASTKVILDIYYNERFETDHAEAFPRLCCTTLECGRRGFGR